MIPWNSQHLVPTRGYPSPCCLAFPASYPLMSLFGYLLYTGPSSTENLFFSQAVFLTISTTNDHHSSSLHTPFFIEPTQYIIMTGCLPLAKLSIQNKIRPPAEMTQPIKMKKVHPLNPPELSHPCSLDTLPSPVNKWSAMTDSLQATIKEFKGMTILCAQYYFHQDCVLLTHASATSTTATTVGDKGNPRRSTELKDESGHNCCMSDTVPILFLDLTLPMKAWAQGLKDISSATTLSSTCSLPTSQQSPTSTRSSTTKSPMIDKPLPVHLHAAPFSLLGLMPSPHQSSNEFGGPTAQSGKPLADHM